MFLTANVCNLNILGQNEKTSSYFGGVMSYLYIYVYELGRHRKTER